MEGDKPYTESSWIKGIVHPKMKITPWFNNNNIFYLAPFQHQRSLYKVRFKEQKQINIKGQNTYQGLKEVYRGHITKLD